MNTRSLMRWASISAMVAGSMFVVVAMFDPRSRPRSRASRWCRRGSRWPGSAMRSGRSGAHPLQSPSLAR
jgi:hypothetical protein